MSYQLTTVWYKQSVWQSWNYCLNCLERWNMIIKDKKDSTKDRQSSL